MSDVFASAVALFLSHFPGLFARHSWLIPVLVLLAVYWCWVLFWQFVLRGNRTR